MIKIISETEEQNIGMFLPYTSVRWVFWYLKFFTETPLFSDRPANNLGILLGSLSQALGYMISG